MQYTYPQRVNEAKQNEVNYFMKLGLPYQIGILAASPAFKRNEFNRRGVD